jgi:hypothetical protein
MFRELQDYASITFINPWQQFYKFACGQLLLSPSGQMRISPRHTQIHVDPGQPHLPLNKAPDGI